MAGLQVLTVTQINTYIKSLLDGDRKLSGIYVKGEISNFTNHYSSGHFYFTLKDKESAIKAVMFRRYASGIRFRPENGMSVVVRGDITVYPRDGVYQIYAYDMQPDGLGALHLAFEQLKRRLEAEGLFDAAAKRPLPPYPQGIGIVTSATGAALQDILNILRRRYPLAQILLYPALVQGEEAPPQLIQGIEALNRRPDCDLIILARGGGSMEDLWAFNNEALARAIRASRLPVVSAVGHEIDFTIADFAADLRAPTPSAAAELVSPDIRDLYLRLDQLERLLNSGMEEQIETRRRQLDQLGRKNFSIHARNFLNINRQKLDNLVLLFNRGMHSGLEKRRLALVQSARLLEGCSPLKVIARGYAVVRDDMGDALSSVKGVVPGQTVQITMTDGLLRARVESVEQENEKVTEEHEANLHTEQKNAG